MRAYKPALRGMQGDSATRPCTRPPCGCTLGRSGGASLRIGGGELRYRPDIDGLRCVAIVAVLLAHADLGWFRGGYVGVDVFFVVSGFLITRILWPGPRTELDAGPGFLLAFYERRARRILPALTVVVAATLAASFATLGPQRFVEVARSAVATAFFVSNLHFWRTLGDYFGTDVRLQPLLHTWSLAVEEQFYLLFPLLLALLARAGRVRALVALALICLLSFALAQHAVTGGRQQAAFFLLHARAWELGVGAALALAPLPLPRHRPVVESLALLAAAAILVPVVAYDAVMPFPGLAALPPVLGTAALIWLHGGRDSAVKTALRWRPVVFIGLVSYSVYLWHWPIVVFDRIVLGEPTPARSLACVAVSLALGAASWRWIERPFRDPSGPLRGRRVAFAAAGAATAAVAIAGAAIVLSGGLPGRLPPEALRLYAASDDVHPLRGECRTAARIGVARCRIGAPAVPEAPADFLLWGDSHAEALLPAVEAAAIRAGKSGFATILTGCAPLLHVDRVDEGPPTRCSAYADAVMTFLPGRDDLPLVILSARWELSARGTRSDEPSRAALLVNRAHDLPSGRFADNFAAFTAGIADTVAAIGATGRRTVILGSVPEIGWSVPDGLGQSLVLGRPAPAAPDAAVVAARNARSDAVFAALASRPGVAYLPLAPILCTPVCAVTDAAGRPAYIDDDHMSRAGAAGLLAGPLHDAIWGKGTLAAAR